MDLVGIPSSVDDKKLLYCFTVCSILGDINLVCDSNDIEDCHRIKEDRTMIKFSSRRKSSEVLNKKKKLKYLDIESMVSVMDQGSTSMKVSVHNTANSGVN